MDTEISVMKASDFLNKKQYKTKKPKNPNLVKLFSLKKLPKLQESNYRAKADVTIPALPTQGT